ncbi:MAG: succinylglutamate desuccinylase/aspartoacylase family protein [Thiotrichales bacterium]|nr:succinylglutamate desuccinylase/aspartoacylase family protein [Thiotrichales bacterium]
MTRLNFKKTKHPLLLAIISLSWLVTPTLSSAQNNQTSLDGYCQEWAKKLRTVQYNGCKKLDLQAADIRSFENRLLTFREFIPQTKEGESGEVIRPRGKILFISGIHGDEYSAISITYLWMLAMVNNQHALKHHWLFLPIANPDGLFRSDPATRTNARGVDMNRNFPSPDWDELALKYWQQYTGKNERRYPGPHAASEIETQWLVDTIRRFQPDAIVSVHAPYGLLDYDGPEHAMPTKIGMLKHRELGTYPGSLGRYAGEYLGIPVLTLELLSAGTMPKEGEIIKMWQDIEAWSNEKIQNPDRDF